MSVNRSLRVILLFVAAGLLMGASVRSSLRRGNVLYEEGKFENALEAYSEALAADPDSPEAHFNLGAAMYRMEKADEAMRAFAGAAATVEQVTGESSGLSVDAAYNAANSAYRLEQYDQAIALYTKVLLVNPKDVEAKRNLELALQKLKEQEEEEQEQNEQQQQEDSEEDNPENDQSDQEQQDEQEKGSDEQEQEHQDSGEPTDPEDQEQEDPKDQPKDGQSDQDITPQDDEQKKPPPTQEQISKEQLKQLLENLERKEAEALKEAAQERLRKEGAGKADAKDW